MYVAKDLGLVRIVHDGSPFEVAYDIRVEWLVDNEWKLYRGFNSLSNDYAFGESGEAAGRAVKVLAEKAANLIGTV
jgi:hypothetical protein